MPDQAAEGPGQTKWTPGPWRLAEMHAEGFYMNDGAVAVLSDGSRVALVDIQSKPKRGQGHTAKCEQRDANARLIAAAPTMYDALESLALMADAMDMPDMATIARAALAAAGRGT